MKGLKILWYNYLWPSNTLYAFTYMLKCLFHLELSYFLFRKELKEISMLNYKYVKITLRPGSERYQAIDRTSWNKAYKIQSWTKRDSRQKYDLIKRIFCSMICIKLGSTIDCSKRKGGIRYWKYSQQEFILQRKNYPGPAQQLQFIALSL
jgi:hypothetical protein